MELPDNDILPFLGIKVSINNDKVETSVFRKKTNKGLLLHYHSSVDEKYKIALVRTMLHRAYRISSSRIYIPT